MVPTAEAEAQTDASYTMHGDHPLAAELVDCRGLEWPWLSRRTEQILKEAWDRLDQSATYYDVRRAFEMDAFLAMLQTHKKSFPFYTDQGDVKVLVKYLPRNSSVSVPDHLARRYRRLVKTTFVWKTSERKWSVLEDRADADMVCVFEEGFDVRIQVSVLQPARQPHQ